MRRSAIRAARGRQQARTRGHRSPVRVLADTAHATRAALRRDGQAGLLLRSSHPLQSVCIAVAIGVLAFSSDRGLGPSLIAALAVLLTQLALGLHNDASDASLDARSKASGKPVGAGELPATNANFVALLLVVVSIPVALLNGTVAGPALLLTLPIGYVHNRILHRTRASFLGWMATFALYPVFLAYGGWGGGRHGDDPTWQFVVVSAFAGLCVHFATALPDLVTDNAAGIRSLPLWIALRTGAPRLLIATIAMCAIVLAAFVWVGLDPGLRRW